MDTKLGQPEPEPMESRNAMNADDDAKWLEWVSRQFETIAGEDREIDLQEFKTALKVKESFFAERFFALFDSDGSGTITLQELLGALNLLIHGNTTDKLKFLFQVYDLDGSGSIDPDELRTVLQSCLKESSISLPEEKLDDLTLALFESADKDHNGSITFEELREELDNFPEVMENLTISAASWLKPPSSKKRPQMPRFLTSAYWHNNTGKLAVLAAYIGVNILLFTLAALKYQASGASLMVARGGGQCLNFNCSFIVVLMLRRCLTWLRATWLARVFPLDQNVEFHQLVGYVVFGFTLIHTIAHVVNFVRLSQLEDSPFQFWEYLLTTRPGIGWVHGTASLTGIVLQLLILIMLVCSCSFVRRRGHFEVFYWTHLSYIWVWVLLIIHGPHFWKWLLAPGLLFFLEKVVGLVLSRMATLCIVEVNLLSSKVTHLVISRPSFFHYKPGDYIYLNIPAIAKYEWHPFTISSAPEQEGTIWLHIRSQGQWTNRLYNYFKASDPICFGVKRLTQSLKFRRSQRKLQETKIHVLGAHSANTAQGVVATSTENTVQLMNYTSEKLPQQNKEDLIDYGKEREEKVQPRSVFPQLNENHRFCNIKCYLDGPYGTPTRRIFASEHAVLIGAGIGITPFASILQSIMYRHQKRKRSCPNCHYSWCENVKGDEMKLKKVDFIWINRDQRSFEWFVSLLTKLEMDQAEEEPGAHFLELHMYMTSALGKNDMKAIGLQMALDLLAKKENKDSITGLKTRTQPGRPDWGKVFGKVAAENKGKVQVFFCGSPALAKVLKSHCEQLNFRFFKENF
ncbi:NADPH oxidase 5 isoform X1 [Phascolarctos cinereus]|uniref:NADPH oxidase 5 isoform X1 n=2 Tax=Phascolarctos cinereus TaxID=38626 RepID=A0A6P5JYW5_PHACI|nr:NADPH oxidase 5 isoform X1 [Phascolarctos cinereus]XP_020837977.1 NADPH oxidase 5 isoform X1 [Phascolarctos cinereus]